VPACSPRPKNTQPNIDNRDRADNDAVARVLLEHLSGLPMANVPGDPHGLLERANRPNFGGWLAHVAKARGCTQPVRLRGDVLTVQATTGRVLERFSTDELPDRILYKPCGTRLASRCPACAQVYRWDTYQLIKAGLAGGKGVPETVSTHPAVFVTLTAPSFGVVHTRDHHKAKPCRPRRDKPVCRTRETDVVQHHPSRRRLAARASRCAWTATTTSTTSYGTTWSASCGAAPS
jgi:hypothetical protein